MMSAICVLLAKRAFSDLVEDLDSKKFSLAPLASLIPTAFCIEIANNF